MNNCVLNRRTSGGRLDVRRKKVNSVWFFDLVENYIDVKTCAMGNWKRSSGAQHKRMLNNKWNPSSSEKVPVVKSLATRK